jgi:hypothetical protein
LQRRNAAIIDPNLQHFIPFGYASTGDGTQADIPGDVRQCRRDEMFQTNTIIDGPSRMRLADDELQTDDTLK